MSTFVLTEEQQSLTILSNPSFWEIRSDWITPNVSKINVKEAPYFARGDDATIDSPSIAAAVNAMVDGSTLVFPKGVYRINQPVKITKLGCSVEFEKGAELMVDNSWAIGQFEPVLQISASRCIVHSPRIRGSGNKGNGTGILLVDTTDQSPGGSVNWSGVHDCTIVDPEVYNCQVGVDFGIVATDGSAVVGELASGGNSTGDCVIIGGSIRQCNTGIANRGFTNRAFSTRIYSCDTLVDCTNNRTSQKFEGYGLTLSQWDNQAIAIRSGNGSTFHNTWMEHTNEALQPSHAVLIGGIIGTHDGVTDVNDREVVSPQFTGTTKITMHSAATSNWDLFKLINCRGLYVEDLTISTNGTPPRSVVRAESTVLGNNNRIKRAVLMPGRQALNDGDQTTDGWNLRYPVGLSSSIPVGGPGEVIIEELFDVQYSGAGTSIGGGAIPDPSATYTVFRNSQAQTLVNGAITIAGATTITVDSTAGFMRAGRLAFPGQTKQCHYTGITATSFTGVTGWAGIGAATTIPDNAVIQQAPTYFAKNKRGHIVVYGADNYAAPLASGLKTVLETLDQEKDGTHIHFVKGRFHFLDAPLGTEVGIAGELDHATIKESYGLEFSGESTEATIISNRTGFDPLRTSYYAQGGTSGADTEPFSFTKCPRVRVRDMTVEGCGCYRSTTDAIDIDQSTDAVVERVRVTRSRSRGIKVDDGNPGSRGGGNNIRDCVVIGCPDAPQIDGRSGGTLVSGREYRYALTWVDMDSNAPNKQMETRPSEGTKFVAYSDLGVDYFTARVMLPFGPYSCVARKIYRWDSSGLTWQHIKTIDDNTTQSWDDIGSGYTPTTASFTKHSTIPQAGIEYLSSRDGGVCSFNRVFGTGDAAPVDTALGPNGEPVSVTNPAGLSGAVQHGINMNRKATFAHTNQPTEHVRIIGNRVRGSAGFGIRLGGANDCIVALNDIANPGFALSADNAAGIRIENIISATGTTTSDSNLIAHNIIRDSRADGTHPTGLPGMNYGIQVADGVVNGAGMPTNTVVGTNIIRGYLTARTQNVAVEPVWLQGSKTWAPATAIPSLTKILTTVTVVGVLPGDTCLVSWTSTGMNAGHLVLSGLVQTTPADTVQVTLFNTHTASLTPASGTLKVDVIQR